MAELLVTPEDLVVRPCVCGVAEGCACEEWTDAEALAHWDRVVRREVAKALRGVDTEAMSRAWGGDAAWFTSGAKVAGVVGDWLSQDADEVESGAVS